jgi:hypothetical protein
MKFLFIGILMSLSFSALSAEECKLTVKSYRPEFESFKRISTKNKLVRTWEDCYREGIKEAERHDFEFYTRGVEEYGYSSYHIGTWLNQTVVEWNFNDSYFYDSSGAVTFFTKTYETAPEKGNHAVDSHGFLLY